MAIWLCNSTTIERIDHVFFFLLIDRSAGSGFVRVSSPSPQAIVIMALFVLVCKFDGNVLWHMRCSSPPAKKKFIRHYSAPENTPNTNIHDRTLLFYQWIFCCTRIKSIVWLSVNKSVRRGGAKREWPHKQELAWSISVVRNKDRAGTF